MLMKSARVVLLSFVTVMDRFNLISNASSIYQTLEMIAFPKIPC